MDDCILISFQAGTKKRTEGKKAQRLKAIRSYKRGFDHEKKYGEVIGFVVDDHEEYIKVYPASMDEAYDFGRFMQSWDLMNELHESVKR